MVVLLIDLFPENEKTLVFNCENFIRLSKILSAVVNWRRPKLITPILTFPRRGAERGRYLK